MSKPTLQAIADMPLMAGIQAMRQHYNPNWQGALGEPGDGPIKTMFRVSIGYTCQDEVSYTVDAKDDDEAYDIAREIFEKEYPAGTYDVSYTHTQKVEAGQ